MVASANISDSSSGRLKETKIVLLLPFRLHPHTNSAITRPSLVVLKNGLSHLVPHVILHLVIYQLSIVSKMADDTMKTEFGFRYTVEPVYYGHLRTSQECPDYQGVLIFQVSLHDNVSFGTTARCVDYAGVHIFKCPD